MSSPTPAGQGQHYCYGPLKLSPLPNPQDTEVFNPGEHYLGIDVVRWYVNQQANFLRDKMASGTCQIVLASENYAVGLGNYDLKHGSRTAPLFDQEILANRVYHGGNLTLKVFVGVIASDNLLGGLLRDMAVASLAAATGAIGAATTAGPMAVAIAAGTSMTNGVKKILSQGKNSVTVFDDNGTQKTLDLTRLQGPSNYFLFHRGAKLDQSLLAITNNRGDFDVLYNGNPLDDGAWVLFEIRREDKFGTERPWNDDAVEVRNGIRNLFDKWGMGGETRDNVLKQLSPSEGGSGAQPTLGDRVLSVLSEIRADSVLAERERVSEVGKLKSFWQKAKKSAEDHKPEDLDAGWLDLQESLKKGVRPTDLLTAQIFTSEARHLTNMTARSLVRGMKVADLSEKRLWKTLSYVQGETLSPLASHNQ